MVSGSGLTSGSEHSSLKGAVNRQFIAYDVKPLHYLGMEGNPLGPALNFAFGFW
jgi:hypothetical protein